ncbi:DNA alkylation repair protein [Subtercola vilae]|uniref:DNA alkylation repair protein n=1 Tax=Subtercola vilae TaxID=2056433 RepID=A0A4T2C4J0_9MICO|nr:DNA alkylation repair protein [Subtercola vilae]TIH38629.1 DNA alkylation repair protein [Subtercola vilae]
MPTADELLGAGVALRLAEVMGRAVPGNGFAATSASVAELGPLSLRQRSDLLKDALLSDLPGSAAALDAAIRSALSDAAFTGWMIWPVTEAVTSRALEARTGFEGGSRGGSGSGSSADADSTFDAAMVLLADLTPRLTAEFAIRPLLEADLGRALPIIRSWSQSPNEHVRRLASEGTRAFLPWAKRVQALLAQPESTLPIITALYRDESEYVRRSVANHLNDLSRQNPDLAARVAAEWMHSPDQNTPKLVRHAMRSLIKKGHPAALALFGFAEAHGVEVSGLTLGASAVAVGGELPFTVTLTNPTAAPVKLVVDYIVHHRKANGSQTAKVFKLQALTLDALQSVTLTRRHSFKRITTRVYHSGAHAIEVQVNGSASGRSAFTLTAD